MPFDTLWIGTNDVGVNALLTGSQTPGVTVVDTVTCAVDWVQTLYDSGARNFIFQNVSVTLSECTVWHWQEKCAILTS